MILDILPVSTNSASLSSVEPWAHMETYDGQYNPGDPGDCYFPGQQCDKAASWLEWHAAEGGHRWTAACDAGMAVVINPGEHFLTVQAMSGFPGYYVADVCLDGTCIGQLEFLTAGVTTVTFPVKGRAAGPARLSFRVPSLWQPASRLAGSQDTRHLGIAVCSVRLSPPGVQ